jgi:hypothetical protein
MTNIAMENPNHKKGCFWISSWENHLFLWFLWAMASMAKFKISGAPGPPF